MSKNPAVEASKLPKFPRSRSSILIGRAIRRLEAMSDEEGIQLMVPAGLMTQAEADEAKRRLREQAAAE